MTKGFIYKDARDALRDWALMRVKQGAVQRDSYDDGYGHGGVSYYWKDEESKFAQVNALMTELARDVLVTNNIKEVDADKVDPERLDVVRRFDFRAVMPHARPCDDASLSYYDAVKVVNDAISRVYDENRPREHAVPFEEQLFRDNVESELVRDATLRSPRTLISQQEEERKYFFCSVPVPKSTLLNIIYELRSNEYHPCHDYDITNAALRWLVNSYSAFERRNPHLSGQVLGAERDVVELWRDLVLRLAEETEKQLVKRPVLYDCYGDILPLKSFSVTTFEPPVKLTKSEEQHEEDARQKYDAYIKKLNDLLG